MTGDWFICAPFEWLNRPFLARKSRNSCWFQSQCLSFNSHFSLNGNPWTSNVFLCLVAENFDLSRCLQGIFHKLWCTQPVPQGLHSARPSQHSAAKSIWKARSAPWRYHHWLPRMNLPRQGKRQAPPVS